MILCLTEASLPGTVVHFNRRMPTGHDAAHRKVLGPPTPSPGLPCEYKHDMLGSLHGTPSALALTVTRPPRLGFLSPQGFLPAPDLIERHDDRESVRLIQCLSYKRHLYCVVAEMSRRCVGGPASARGGSVDTD